MNQNYHHQQQWHSNPVQGTLCPICSMPHFPFCPPVPSFHHNPNPRFPFSPTDQYHAPMCIPRPFIGSPNDGIGDQRLSIRNFNLERESFGQSPFHPPPPPYIYGSEEYVSEADRNYKRQRVDDVFSGGSGAYMREINKKSPNGLSEDERRLKLIHDHGLGGPPDGRPISTPGMNLGVSNEAKRYIHDNSVFEGSYGRPGAGEQVGYAGFQIGKSDSGPVANKKMETNNLQDHVFGSAAGGRNELHYTTHEVPGNQRTFSGLDVPYQRNSDRDNHPIYARHMQLQGHQQFPGIAQNGHPKFNDRLGYSSHPSARTRFSEGTIPFEASRLSNEQPPLPTSPPPPLPRDAQLHSSTELKAYFSLAKPSSLFPLHVSSSEVKASSCPPVPESHITNSYYYNPPLPHASTGFVVEGSHPIHHSLSKKLTAEEQPFALKQLVSDKPKVIDASQLFKLPHRVTRPDHFVVILRGLPGSGKSYLAKMLRDLEVENGGDAPRIHSMDDYFMTEVEKVEEGDISRSSGSGSVKGKRPVKKKVMEYCYEPEMEEAYRSSMLKSFKKTLEEGAYTFVIVDDRNLRVADFAQFWAIAKSSGYEVYILEAAYKDPAGCAARNVHAFTLDDIQKMAGQWEESPALYLQLNIKSLFHGDDLKESGIREVDMDMEDGDFDEGLSNLQENRPEKTILCPLRDDATDDDRKKWDAQRDHPKEEVKELGRSKWSDDLDEADAERTAGMKGNSNALSGLIPAYTKEGKSVRWSDKVGNTGFSIGAVKKSKKLSLVIGPGAGYNRKSNPLPEEDDPTSIRANGEMKRQNIFQERLRAERESFKAVFDKRRQRIGIDWEEES